MSIPVIDIRGLPVHIRRNIDEIKKVGCFYLKFGDSLKPQLQKLSHIKDTLFNLSDVEKNKLSDKPGHGYIIEKQQKESYYFWINEDNKVPEIEGFQETIEDYCISLLTVFQCILQELFYNIGIDDVTTWDIIFKSLKVIRLIKYLDEKEILSREHTDYGLMTFLYTVEPGLQIFLNDTWQDVQVKPDCLIVNFGDMMQYISGGKINAIKHRVLNNHCNKSSIVLFVDPDPSFKVDEKEYIDVLNNKILEAMLEKE